MSTERPRQYLVLNIIFVILVILSPLLYTAFLLFLGKDFAGADSISPFLMLLLSSRFYLVTIGILTILTIITYGYLVRKNLLYLIGTPFQVMSLVAAFFIWLVQSPRISITDMITDIQRGQF
jgi:hypothetical protein